MKFCIKLSALFLGFICFCHPLQAQDGLQTPSEFLGYKLGSQWTPHHRVMDYFRHIEEQSALVQLEQYGETYEGRELMLAYIASEGNLESREQIRIDNLRRAGLSEGDPSEDKTAIIWLSYNVHGNEASSSEAAMKTAYDLVRPGNTDARQWLENTIVIMDPMLNPDGRDRYVNWYRQTAGRQFNAHGDAREHHEPWPGGRTNHYYFDLNRDWAWVTQQEMQQRVAEYQKWMPHIHVDFHEQSYTAPYYFAPAAEPFHEAITDWQRDFQYTIGQNNASYFNENNWLYFTREVFDLFYPSYGDTYPIFNGAIGMTYEQGGSGYAGLGIEKPEGDTLTLDDRLTHHYMSGMATIETASRNAEQLVDELTAYYETARFNPEGRFKSFVIKGDSNPDKLRRLFEMLDTHQIQYGKIRNEETLEAYSYQTGFYEEVTVTEDDYLVSLYQPKSVLARVLFEPRPQLSDSVTYDITAWEQHYAHGVEGYAVTGRMELAPAEAPQKKVENMAEGAPYAYLAHWEDYQDVAMLAELLREDIGVRFARSNFTVENGDYEAGTLIITRGDNERRDDFDELIQRIATHYNQQLYPVQTGFVQSGTDFGSSSVRYMEKPQVAMLSGEGTSSGTVGEIWHYFDQQIQYPLTLIDTDDFNDVDLGRYEVLILPSGNYHNVIEEEQTTAIRDWLSGGGKLIAVGSANNWLAGQKGFALMRKEQPLGQENHSPAPDELTPFEERRREQITEFNAGAVFRITMDNSHPLAFGYGEEYFSLKLNADAYGFLEDGWNVGVTGENAHMSGFVGFKAERQLRNTLTFGVQSIGEGSVVYMADNPLFRAFWQNGKLLFGNAVFMVGQ